MHTHTPNKKNTYNVTTGEEIINHLKHFIALFQKLQGGQWTWNFWKVGKVGKFHEIWKS